MNDKILKTLNDVQQELIELSFSIYNNPEMGYKEQFACKQHVNVLKKHGFNVEEKFSGIETAYKAWYKSEKDGATIAFMAEYDALPGIGHGCGHNILGATSVGAGIALKSIIDEIGGSVIVFGTPAEETSGAKVTMVDNHEFDNVDIAIIAHPSNKYQKSGQSLALEPIQFEFFGQTAHAASCPEKGINALDAAINTFNNINALREHIKSDARIHGIITDGGKAANIVPDYAQAQFYVRATTKTYLTELVEKVKNCAKGAALATGTRLEISKYEFSYDNIVTNQKLLEVFCSQLSKLTDAKIHEPSKDTGSTDAGNVSQVCPTIHPYFDITNDEKVNGHTIELAECTTTQYAYDQMKITAQALAMTGAEIIQNKELLKEIKEEFEKAEK